MRRLFAALAMLLSSGPAFATGSIACEGVEDEVSVELAIGSLPVLAVVGAVVGVDGEAWSLGAEGEYAIVVGQAFAEDDRILVDFTDDNVERIVARLRLVTASEGNDHATAGILAVAGRGAWAVSCIGP